MLILTNLMMFLHMFVGLILIGIILLQRGRGGGLAGAFGGMGGQSAFGTKAGDVFTRITIVLATVWIVLGCVCVLLASNVNKKPRKATFTDTVKTAPAEEKSATDKKPDEGVIPALKDDKEAVPGDTPKKEEGKKDPADQSTEPAKKADEPAPANDAKPDSKDAPAEKPADPEKKAEEKKSEEPEKKPEEKKADEPADKKPE